jgi:hypothetical protein
MERRLTTEQLELIVGEVGRLANRQQAELDRAEVQKILVELNLPPELLDEATIQVQRKQALARQQQRHRQMALASIAAVAVIAIGTSIFFQNKAAQIAKIVASQDRITLVQDRGDSLQTVTRGTEIVYRVKLDGAPVGEQLSITCNWIDPTGKIDRTNRYQTKNVNSPTWNTQCRDLISADAPTGKWQVEMRIGDRILRTASFVVN